MLTVLAFICWQHWCLSTGLMNRKNRAGKKYKLNLWCTHLKTRGEKKNQPLHDFSTQSWKLTKSIKKNKLENNSSRYCSHWAVIMCSNRMLTKILNDACYWFRWEMLIKKHDSGGKFSLIGMHTLAANETWELIISDVWVVFMIFSYLFVHLGCSI